MIKNKKMLMTLSFCLGAVMLATTAFADITIKTGYDQLKDSAKFTAENLTEKLQSYTMESTFSIKDNDTLLASSTNLSKVDNVNKQHKNSYHNESTDGKKLDSFTYMDDKTMISYNSDNDTYYVNDNYYTNDFSMPGTYTQSPNPFKQSGAKDIEKIADALVGNLKDYIIVNDKADGSKELSGSLSEAQIPALVNAVASFGFKRSLSGGGINMNQNTFPEIEDDIFVKNVKGNINTNKDGIIESFLGSATLTGKDKAGKSHDLTIEALIRISDINSTTVTKPDLTGKKIEKNIQINKASNTISQSFVGTYKNNIVISKDDKFVKIGERTVEITEIKDNHILGRYTDEYKPEYASEYAKNEFTFEAEVKDPFNAQFTSTFSDGKKSAGNISWNMQGGSIYFFDNRMNHSSYDGNFSRVFD